MTALRRQRQDRILLGVCLLIGAVVNWAVFAADDATYVYGRTVKQALEEVGTGHTSRIFRVRGLLVGGSLTSLGACEWGLSLYPERDTDGVPRDMQPELRVRYRACHLPETLCDLPNFELTLHVTGRLVETGSGWSMQADNVLPVCPAKYSVSDDLFADAPEPARRRCPMCSGAMANPTR